MFRSRKFLVGLLVLGLLPALGVAVVDEASGTAGAAPTASTGVPRPNIVVILTDDQRRHTFGTMPVVQRRIIDKGAKYDGIAPTPLCCPVRTSLLSGNYSHTTGIYTNTDRRGGGWPQFHQSGQEKHTIATALDTVGYRTGLIGKYLNGWGKAPAGFVPPGWDVFHGFWFERDNEAASYYDYWLKGTAPAEWYGSHEHDYSTDVSAQHAARFIRSTPSGRPLFLMWTPYGPHRPSEPAPRDRGTWQAAHPYRNKAVNEERMGDKQRFFQHLNPVDLSEVDRIQDRTMESLRSIDDGVRRILRALGPRRDNTLIIYASDQGLLWGEHRMISKNLPYQWSTEYPLFIRWDGHLRAGTVHRLVPHVDLSATILDAANAGSQLEVAGRSILQSGRSQVVLEGVRSVVRGTDPLVRHPAYCGVRTHRYLYVNWSGDRKSELYDYRKDHLELHSVGDHAGYQAIRDRLQQAAGQLCSPVPPGYEW
jgi:N-acetylglucosamine-6-sulfatase